MLQIPAPNVLQLLIDRPFAKRPLISPFHYVDEACFLNHVSYVWRYQHVLPKLLTSFDSKASQTMQYVIWGDGAVVRNEFRCGFTMLDVAAWGDMTEGSRLACSKSSGSFGELFSLKALFVEGGPVRNASIEKSHVHVVEMIQGIDPFATAVVDLETKIFGWSSLIGRGEIGPWVRQISTDTCTIGTQWSTNHFCSWELVCDVPTRRVSCHLRDPIVAHTMPKCQFQYLCL